MNKERRKSLREIQSKLESLGQDLEALKDEEEEYRDNMPENLQESDRYQQADEVCDLLVSLCIQMIEIMDIYTEAEVLAKMCNILCGEEETK